MSILPADSPPSVSRRTVLIGSAAAAVGGVLGSWRGVAVASDHSPVDTIASATAWRGSFVALMTDPDATAGRLRQLDISDGGEVAIGAPLDVALPRDFSPHSIAARGDRLWVTGAVDELVDVIEIDNRPGAASTEDRDPAMPEGVFNLEVRRSRPALVRVDAGTARYADLPVPAGIESGVATAIQVVGDHLMAVAIDGCSDPDVAMVTRSHVAVSRDGGGHWQHRLLTDGLGEGYSALLAITKDHSIAVTASESDAQTFYAARPGVGASFEPIATIADAGRPVAATITGTGQLIVFSDRDGELRRSSYELGGRTARSGLTSSASCGCAGQVVVVAGVPGMWIESDGADARAYGL